MALRGSVYLLDANSRTTVAMLTEHRHSVDRVVMSPDGTSIAAVGGSAVTIWEMTGFEHLVR